MAVAVGLLFFAGVVFYTITNFTDSHTTRDDWQRALYVLSCVGTAVSYCGLRLGLGTLATARSKALSSRANAVASLLSKAGAALVVLGVAESVCIIGGNVWSGWRGDASMVAFRVAGRVFVAGVALLCLRQSKPGGLQGGLRNLTERPGLRPVVAPPATKALAQ